MVSSYETSWSACSLRLQRAREEPPHGLALAAVEVVHVVVAQRLDEEVEVVRLRRGRAPRVVRATSDEDQWHAREHGASHVEAGAGELHLREELREEVPDLRAGDEERVTRLRPLRADQQRVRGEGRRRQRCAGEAAVVEQRASRRRGRGSLLRERSGQAHGSLGIVGLAQVGEHATGVGVTESIAQRVQEHCVPDLLPAVRAETSGDQRGGRNHVVRGERRRRDPLRRVVAVDPGRIGFHQREDLRPHSALRAKSVDLIRQERLGLRARDEALARQRERERIESRARRARRSARGRE